MVSTDGGSRRGPGGGIRGRRDVPGQSAMHIVTTGKKEVGTNGISDMTGYSRRLLLSHRGFGSDREIQLCYVVKEEK